MEFIFLLYKILNNFFFMSHRNFIFKELNILVVLDTSDNIKYYSYKNRQFIDIDRMLD